MTGDLVLQQITEADEAQFSELLDRCFQVPEGSHYLDDFPVWRGKKSDVLKIGAFDGAKLVGTAAVRLADLNGARTTASVGLIGAVSTDENYRGKGIATKLVSVATDWAENRKAILVALWGSEHHLYSKIGFSPCGRQIRVDLSTLVRATEKPVSVYTGLHSGLFRLLQARKTGVQLTEVDRLWYFKHRNVKWYWTGSEDHPSAYVGFERGIDLAHLVHEWGGESENLLPLLGVIAEKDGASQLLGAPETLSHYGIQYNPAQIEYLCLAKVVDAARVFRLFVSEEQIPKFEVRVLDGGMWDLEIEDRAGVASHLEIHPDDLSQFFFGPRTALAPPLSKPWAGVLPLPLWFWGLDAV